MLILGNQPPCSEEAHAIWRGPWFSGLAEVPGDSQHHLANRLSAALEAGAPALSKTAMDSVWSTDEPPYEALPKQQTLNTVNAAAV